MGYPPNFANLWDITQPPDTQQANLLGLDLRTLRNDIMQRMALLSGALANRPTPETVNATWGGVVSGAPFGLLYFATDNGHIYQWQGGGGWVDVTSSFFTSTNVPVLIASANVSVFGQLTAIPVTTIYTPSNPGIYRISGEMHLTVIGTGSGGATLGAVMQWTDNVNVKQFTFGNLFINTLVSSLTFSQTFYSTNGQPIQYFTQYAGMSTPATYDIFFRLEFLGT